MTGRQERFPRSALVSEMLCVTSDNPRDHVPLTGPPPSGVEAGEVPQSGSL